MKTPLLDGIEKAARSRYIQPMGGKGRSGGMLRRVKNLQKGVSKKVRPVKKLEENDGSTT